MELYGYYKSVQIESFGKVLHELLRYQSSGCTSHSQNIHHAVINRIQNKKDYNPKSFTKI